MLNKLYCTTAAFILSVSIIFIAGNTFTATAKLKDFKDDVEREEQSSGGSSGGSVAGDCIGSCLGSIFEEIGKALRAVWVLHHSTVYYTSYPYAENNEKFIKKVHVEKKNLPVVELDENTALSDYIPPTVDIFKNKFYYYTLTTGGQWAQGDGSGFLVEIRGKFWQFWGPELTARSLWDGKDNLQYYSAGLNISIFQTNFMSMDLYAGGSFMRGILARNGGAYGVIITSFPKKPASFSLKLGGISYEKISFFDFEAKIGLLINRVELFIGYQFISSQESFLGGPIGGVTVFL